MPDTFNYAAVIDGFAKDSTRMALIWINADGDKRRFTFQEVSEGSQRTANMLKAQGVGKGDRVIVMLPRIPEWQMTMLAIFRIGAVAVPCVTMLLPKGLENRIDMVQAVVTARNETEKFVDLPDESVARFSIGYGLGGRLG